MFFRTVCESPMQKLHVVPPGGFPEDDESVFAALGAVVHHLNARLARLGRREQSKMLAMLRSHCDTAAPAGERQPQSA